MAEKTITDTYVQLPPDSTGKRVRALTGGALPATVYQDTAVLANPNGYLLGQVPTWSVLTDFTANVAAARTTFIDLFNASGSGVTITVIGVWIIPALTAVAGVGLTWEGIRTSAIGTGGSVATPAPMDTNNPALPAGVTVRIKPTGGATTAATLISTAGSSEETSTYASLAGMINHVGSAQTPPHMGHQLPVIHEGQGFKVDQTFSSNIGTTNIRLLFIVE